MRQVTNLRCQHLVPSKSHTHKSNKYIDEIESVPGSNEIFGNFELICRSFLRNSLNGDDGTGNFKVTIKMSN